MRIQNWRGNKWKLAVLLSDTQVYLRSGAETTNPQKGSLVENPLRIHGFVPGEGVRYDIPNSRYVESREKSTHLL